MQYYALEKKITFNSSVNDKLVRDYIQSHLIGHRVFDGNFDRFNTVNLLEMLGCTVKSRKNEDGKYKLCVVKLHAYEQDADALITLINALE